MRYNQPMMNSLFLLLTALILLSGCVNERGISLRYYNDCEEYYDLQGTYHKKCDENIVDYQDIKEALTPASSAVKPKVW